MSTFHPNLQVKHPLTAPCDGSEIDKKPRKLDEKLATDPSILANRRGLKSGPEFAAILHINGSPELKNTNFGDGYLSAMLSLVEAKLAFMQVWANAAVGKGFPCQIHRVDVILCSIATGLCAVILEYFW